MNRTTDSRDIDTPRKRLMVALASLLGAGLLLGITTNLAKLAGVNGFTPLAYLTWSLAGATVLLFAVSSLRNQFMRLNRRSIEYSLVSALLTVTGSNLIFFSAVEHLGASFIALMLSLPPLLTYVGALMLRMETFCHWRAIGTGLALTGAVYLIAQQWTAPDASTGWLLFTLGGPVLISAGNLYRTRRWPPGASAEALAPGMLLGAVVLLLLFTLITRSSLRLPIDTGYALVLVGLQAAVFAGQFMLLFVLQKTGGPVFLSLMGGVSAIFGVPIAIVALGETILPGFVASAVLIAAGIASMLVGIRACRPIKI